MHRPMNTPKNTFKELLDSVAAALDPAIDYQTQLCDSGYRTLDTIRQAGDAEELQQDCGLPPGDAGIIYQAALGFTSR